MPQCLTQSLAANTAETRPLRFPTYCLFLVHIWPTWKLPPWPAGACRESPTAPSPACRRSAACRCLPPAETLSGSYTQSDLDRVVSVYVAPVLLAVLLVSKDHLGGHPDARDAEKDCRVDSEMCTSIFWNVYLATFLVLLIP